MSDTKSAIKTILNRNVLLIFAIQFFQNISAVMGGVYVGPLGKATGLSVALIGVAGTLYTLCGLFTRAPAARLTDGDKKKLALIIGIGGRGVVYLLMGVFQNNPTMYMILRCLQGITWALIGVCLISCMAVIVDKKVMGTAYAIFNAMLSIGKIIAKPFAQKMYMNHGFMTISVITFATAMLATLLIFFMDFDAPGLKYVPSEEKASKPKKSLNPFKGILVAAIPIAIIGGLARFGYQTDSLYTSVMAVERNLDPSAAFALGSTVATVVGLVVGVLCDFLGAKWLTIIMLLANGIGLIMIGNAHTASALLVAYVVYAGIGGKYDAPVKVLIMKTAPKEKQGAAAATQLLFNDLFSAVAGTVVGFIAGNAGYTVGFGVVGVISVVCALSLVFFSKQILGPLAKLKTEAA